ncbi:MAG: cryptochrome/photolyase family protein [Rhodobacteraceae bacterium]|nr:cryptochrome/photolyase family protein [Paracoccaceae bacterium]
MSKSLVIFPNQLFAQHPGCDAGPDRIVLVEDPLFFGDPEYPATFHKQKLWLHRATMSHYAERLKSDGWSIEIAKYRKTTKFIAEVVLALAETGTTEIIVADPVDHTAMKRLRAAVEAAQLSLTVLDTPGFLNTRDMNTKWSSARKRWFMAEYYKFQRRRLGVLMDGDQPVGGQWSFDDDNRKKVPKAKLADIPALPSVNRSQIDLDARMSIEAEFSENFGSVRSLIYPTTHAGAAAWLHTFLKERLEHFGPYEDAIVEGETWLWHSVLTPMLNVGLLTPAQILEATIAHAEQEDVPLNSVEGFVRQIIGWREFMRATYEDLGVRMRTTNHWGHKRKIPKSFYDATTGIDPVDDTIERILKTGYCHHIERLMVLGGFMFLCEFDPDDVYRWFMEMFVDSYDWVMVPNIYAMSQHSDGGLITTKPYFSGSNYVRKMSHWGKGAWADTWDGLYWRFIHKHKNALGKNPRWAMMCRNATKMSDETRDAHLHNAETFLRLID